MNRLLLFSALSLLVFPVGQACADASGTAQDMPMGQGAAGNVNMLPEGNAGSAEELFGLEGGYLHPYLSLEGGYTDNLFNVDSNKTSNFLTRVSPGIWFTLPRKKIIPITINPNNTSPGGLQLQLDDYEGTDRYQVYALAGTDLYFYSEDTDLNTADVALEGLGRYNMASGLSLQLLDRYSLGHDGFGYGVATDTNQRQFDSNLVMATVDWDLTEKLRFRTDYANFFLSYDDAINDFLERQDNSINLYAYYKYSIKTSFFLQYRFVDVEYDTATETNNKQNFYYGGVTWDTTDKLSLLFKAGLQQKDFDNPAPGFKDSDDLALDLQAKYRITQKTEMVLDLYRMNEESDSIDASEKVVLGTRFGYTQKVTDKITGKFNFSYENADYTQLVAQGRTDDNFELRPAVQYLFKEWLMGELAYSYEVNNSSDDLFDYETNTFLFSLNFAL